ncbi:hypothetical protein C8A00DRAFT_37321 [Chaetomidium leptoderma]|uniref:Uncharacterized protein n=1 Tax=Chaetomidium leptoderma TaxID=669021 RepID=A0AAN6VEN5_9PEZI|nr:hypothetical protein C8A00DRAFT_37321 [Chaetomidium leptoderma]
MSLSAASTFARRGRHSNPIPPTALSSLGSGAVPYLRRQQTRSYRFGRLSSYLEPSFRHQFNGYKYCENLYRRRSWDKHSLTEDAKSTLKRAVSNYWSPRGCHGAAGRYLNTDASPQKTPDNPDGVRPGQTIEDVERAPLEHLLFGDKKGPQGKRRARPSSAQGRAASSTQRNSDPDYVIDPITNRKVTKKPLIHTHSASGKGVEIPVRTFKPYTSQFEAFKAPEVDENQAPFFPDGPPPEAELRMYGQHKLWDPVAPSDRAAANPQKRSAANHHGASRSSLLDTLKWEHREVRWHRNDNISSASATSASAPWANGPEAPEYSDLHLYAAVRYQEPDGKPPGEQTAPEHKDLDKYGAVRAHEPDGKYKAQPDAPAPSQELSKYDAVRIHEPDGKYKVESESPANPQELSKYGAVRTHEPDGKYKADPEISVDSQELDKYGAVRAHEPDGKYKVESESPVHAQELNQYGAVRSHEPDGKYAAEYTDTPDEAELAAYGTPFLAHEPDGKYAANHIAPERDAAELAKYREPFFSHEPDGMYAASYVEPQRNEAELAEYKAFRSHEPDGKYTANYVEEKPESSELASYGAFRSHEPDGKYALGKTTSAVPAETQKYQAFRSHEPDGKYAANHAAEKPDADDLATYGAFRSHEPDGKYAAEAEALKEDEDLANHEAFSYEDAETRPLPQECQPSRGAPDLQGYRNMQHDDLTESTTSSPASQDYDAAELRKYQAVRWNEPDGKAAEAETAGQTLFEYDTSGGASQRSTETASAAGPALYKVLVWDPTMQCIDTAETTSIVPDNAAPLTPAEVLLRISNPAKFFPHFAPLQAQGFEIVSGSGDVLIFRKVRDAAPEAQHSPRLATAAVNPIDMTGERRDYTVAAGRFASPTGFVNYDLPPESTARSERETYHADAPVGEEKAGVKTQKKGKTNLPTRVAVGAASLAGVSYSLGVVSEYFKSGGVDGKGPKGF